MLTGGVRADATSEDLYSLSSGTESILARMHEEGTQPVEIRLYFSETSGKTLPRFIKDFITYERYLRHLLKEYERAANGKIKLRFIDPITDSDDEQDAIKDGLEGRPINQNGDKFFFGLAVETQTGSKETIPFLWPNEQESIEYEITKRLSTLLWPPSKKIGVLSSLEVFGGADNPYMAQMLAAQGRTPPEKWVSIQLLEQAYKVSQIPADTDHLSHDDYDLVIVIHPKRLPEKALWAIDEWVETGGKAIVFVDPYSIADQAPQNPQQPWMALQYEPASSLDPLLDGVGPRDAAADLRRRHRSRGAAAGGARRSGGSGAGRSADDRGHPRRDAPRSSGAQGHRQHPLLPRRRAAREVRRRRRRGAGAAAGETDAAKQTPEAGAAQRRDRREARGRG